MKKTMVLVLLTLIQFLGFSQTAPVVTTSAITAIQSLRAAGGGNVTSDGGSAVTLKGLVWSTSPNPTITYTTYKYIHGVPRTGVGAYTNTYTYTSPNFDNGSGIAPLMPNTTYYVRAFAINAVDTSYGNEVSFTSSVAGTNQKYYFSTSGNDANNGTSPLTPKKTLIGLQLMITGGNVTFLPGDTIFFKRGDVFANGYGDGSGYPYSSLGWANKPKDQWIAPSGTVDKPIVLTNYGDQTLPLPNFIFPTASVPVKGGNAHHTMWFYGCTGIVIDGLQFVDNRFPYADKKTPAYTRASIIFGEWQNTSVGGTVPNPSNPNLCHCDTFYNWGSARSYGDRTGVMYNSQIKNCVFSNTSFGIADIACINCVVTKNTFTNMKSCVDTTGTHDVLGAGIDGICGINLEISYNYFKGASWAKSGRNSSSQGCGGVALDIFDLYNSKIMYNTCIDGRHFMEIGNLDRYDSLAGAQYDTFAFNKIINNTQIGYIHGAVGDPFTGNNHNLYFWNNVVIDNNTSRTSGPKFGWDMYGDGQSYNQFWFYGRPDLPNTYVYRSTTQSFTAGNTTLTMNSVTGVVGGDGTLKNWIIYQDENSNIFPQNNPPYVVSVNTGLKTITLSSAPLVSGSSGQYFFFYPPLSEKGVTWSQPMNPSLSGGPSHTLQYSTDNFQYGMGYDTLIDMRNNIFYNTNGLIELYPNIHGWTSQRFFHSNNVYYVKGGMTKFYPSTFYPSSIGTGVTLGNNERIYSTKIFKDSTAAFPENWDLHLNDTSWAIGKGSPISGFTKDFAGIPLTGTIDIGLYKYTASSPQITLSSVTNVTCKTATNGSIVVTHVANTGTAPFQYKINNGAWGSGTTFSNLASGTYVITIKDSKSLTGTLSVNLKPSSVVCP